MSQRRAALIGTLFLITVLSSNPTAIFGQSFRATLLGVITDAQKGHLPGALVTLSRLDNNATFTTTTDEEGRYSFQQLAPGEYTLHVSATGFAAHAEAQFTLEISQTRRLNIALQAGGVTETITVSATTAVALNTEVGAKTEVMTARQIEDLPLNGRNYLDLAKLLPGVMEAPESTGNLNTNGTRSDATGYIQDGISNRTDRLGGQALVTSPDTIQEFRVETSSYSAQYGRTAGAQIQVISKTGTNRFSGSLFEFVRNDVFDAKDPFLQANDFKKLNRHQYGATLGGPLALPRFGEGGPAFRSGKNRTFFFTSYDGNYEKRSANASTQAPHPDWLKGDFRNIRSEGPDGRLGTTDDVGRVLFPVVTVNPTTNAVTITRREFPTPNVIPDNMISPVARKLLPFIPARNVEGTLMNYIINEHADSRSQVLALRLDQRFSERTTLFGRYGWVSSDSFHPGLNQTRDFFPGFGGTIESRNRFLATGFTHVITPGLINELRFGLNQIKQFYYGRYNGRDMNRELGISNVPVGEDVKGFPEIVIDGFPRFGDWGSWPLRLRIGNYQVSDTLTWVKRGHSIKMGGEFFWTHYDETNYNSPRGEFRFRGRAANPANAVSSGPLSFADFMLGYLYTVQLGEVSRPANFRNQQGSGYVQDDWNVNGRLTLNLGLRYDLLGPLSEKSNRISNYVPQVNKLICATEEKAPCVIDPSYPKALIKNDYNNFSPRIGFALRLGQGNKTVVRGGGGIFYSMGFLAMTRQQFAAGYPFVSTLNYSVTTTVYNPDALRFDSALNKPPSLTGLNTPRGIAVNDPLGSVYQYNLTIEREIVKDLVVELSYVGSQGRHLGRRYNINPLVINKSAINFNLLNTQTDYVLPQIRRLTQLGIGTTIGNVAFGDIIYQENSGTSNYNSGQLTVRRRARRGVVLQGAYVWAKSLDSASFVDAGALGSSFQYPQDPDNLKYEYGLSDFDRTHRFTGSLVWDLPFGRGQRFLRGDGLQQKLFSGWQVNGTATMQTGRPFTPKLPSADFTGQRPDLIGDPLQDVPTGRYFNPFAFGDPSRVASIDRDNPNLYGTAGRGLLRGPNFRPINLSLVRNIPLRERMRAQFRLEAFNVLNQPQFDIPDSTIESPIFDETRTKADRLRLAPNTAAFTRILGQMRELQIGLRLTF